MKLTEREMIVLRHFALDADRSIGEASGTLGLQAHTIRRVLTSLKERGVIRIHYDIDPFRLGFYFFDLYFTCRPEFTPRKAELISFLLSLPNVTYLSELLGDLQFNLVISDRSPLGIQKVLEAASERFGDIFFARTIAQPRWLCDFMPYPLKTGDSYQSREIGGEVSLEKHDDTDLAIVARLAQSPSIGVAEIAKSLQLPVSTTSYRLQALREKKIIAGTRYLINYNNLGVAVYATHLQAKSQKQADRENVFRFCKSHPRINYLVHVTGEFDYSLGTAASLAQEQSMIISDILNKLGDIVRPVRTCPIATWHKVANIGAIFTDNSARPALTRIK